jgi:hypothetical protein
MARYGQYNPYFPNGYNPYQAPTDPRLQQLRQPAPMPVMPQNGQFMPNQPLKTPEQYKEEISKQMGEQLNQYNNYYQQATAQQKMQTNSGSYVKVNSYDEVKNIQAPADGKPVIIIDETNGKLYSKRFDNGQEYIKGFALNPLENSDSKTSEAKQPEPNATTPVEDKNALEAILNRINDRLDKLEGGNKDVNAGNAPKQTEDSKS